MQVSKVLLFSNFSLVSPNSLVERTTATDCRGHFITEKTSQDEASKLRVENIFTDDAEENIPAEAENINVIAFYLIARESGLLLQTVSDILPRLDEVSISFKGSFTHHYH